MIQFSKYLSDGGMAVTWSPLLDAEYLRRLYSRGSRSIGNLAGAYFRRALRLLDSERFDVIWLEKELWPWVPTFLDPKSIRSKAPYVVDYDDAIFHNYDQHASQLVRRVFGTKIDAVMRHADTVVVGNKYLADRAARAGAARIELLPSVVDSDCYVMHQSTTGAGVSIGWIGSPGSQALLEPLIPVLSDCLGSEDRFVTVGARYESPRIANHQIVPWTLASETSLVASFDIGVMPVRDGSFEKGKCGYKLIQYMAAGVPVVASPVGVNTTIVTHGVTGFLASSPEEWRKALMTLKDNKELRHEMGAAGRLAVARRYCTRVVGPSIVSILRAAALRAH